MIYLGLDDTDTAESRGTNQLARLIAERLTSEHQIRWIVRHQLLFDRRVPYTSKNGSASLTLVSRGEVCLERLFAQVAGWMRDEFIPGSDPGLCLCPAPVAAEVVAFARRCQCELMRQSEALALASRLGISLQGLGGTNDGVIGALAAVGLACLADDGRIVQLGDDAATTDACWGEQTIASVAERGVAVRAIVGEAAPQGWVDVGKKLRPNLCGGQPVLWVEPTAQPDRWRALKRV